MSITQPSPEEEGGVFEFQTPPASTLPATIPFEIQTLPSEEEPGEWNYNDDEWDYVPCWACDTTGLCHCIDEEGRENPRCPSCGGTGWCPRCKGNGELEP